MRCRNSSWFGLWSSCSQGKKRRTTSLGFNYYGTQFPCFWIIPMSLRRFGMTCCISPNHSANSSCFWHESSASDAFDSESSKIFSFPRLCRFSTSIININKINLWCKHKFTNMVLSLCWQISKLTVWHFWSAYFDQHLPLQPSIDKRRKQSCTPNIVTCIEWKYQVEPQKRMKTK